MYTCICKTTLSDPAMPMKRVISKCHWKGLTLERSDLSTVFSLNAVKFELVLFILHLNCPSLTSKKGPIRETSPNSLYRIQYVAIHFL